MNKLIQKRLRPPDYLMIIGLLSSFGGLVISDLWNYAAGTIVTGLGILLIGLKDVFTPVDEDRAIGEIKYYLKHFDVMLKSKTRDDEIKIMEKLDTLISEANYRLPETFDEKWFQLRKSMYTAEAPKIRDEMLKLLK